MFNLGSSYFHVALTTVRHLLTVTCEKRLTVWLAFSNVDIVDENTREHHTNACCAYLLDTA